VRHAEQTRSELYLSILPLINSGVCELLDVPRLVHQLVALERRTSGSGRDSVDHPRGAHDDCANAAAGALVLAAPQARTGPRGRVSPPLFRSPATIAAEVAADAERGVRRGRVSSPSRRLPGGPYGSWFIGPNGVERLPDTPVEPREPRLPQPPHRRKLP
jgi:hypothetical protein